MNRKARSFATLEDALESDRRSSGQALDAFVRSGRTTVAEDARASHRGAGPEEKKRISIGFYRSDYAALERLAYQWIVDPGAPEGAKKIAPAGLVRALVRVALPVLESLPPQATEEALLESLRDAIHSRERHDGSATSQTG